MIDHASGAVLQRNVQIRQSSSTDLCRLERRLYGHARKPYITWSEFTKNQTTQRLDRSQSRRTSIKHRNTFISEWYMRVWIHWKALSVNLKDCFALCFSKQTSS
jgi:hypothetical protein